MPKQSPIAEAFDKPFWETCNDGRLVVQNCTACNRLQHPPQATCGQCESGANLDWREVSGRGKIYSYGVVYDSPVASLQADQPFNLAVIELEEDPGVKMLSHLPGIALDAVPIGASVQVMFEPTPGNGQKVPEWQLAG